MGWRNRWEQRVDGIGAMHNRACLGEYHDDSDLGSRCVGKLGVGHNVGAVARCSMDIPDSRQADGCVGWVPQGKWYKKG